MSGELALGFVIGICFGMLGRELICSMMQRLSRWKGVALPSMERVIVRTNSNGLKQEFRK